MKMASSSLWFDRRFALLVVVLAAMTVAASDQISITLPTVDLPSQPFVSTTAPSHAIKNDLPVGANVAIIKIQGLIYGYTRVSLERRVDQAVRSGASLIVIELDTPGGLVNSALKICKFIKSMTVPTVAWVNPEAYSAGIMIAAACNKIVMSPASATGDCAPIVPGMNLSPTERAKALSPILEEFRDSATINQYDYVLFHAMCELGVEVYRIENIKTGQRRIVNRSDYNTLVTNNDTIPSENQEQHEKIDADTTTKNLLPTHPTITTDSWKLVEVFHDGTTLLTVSQKRAMDVALAQAIVRNHTELQKFLGAATLSTIPESSIAMVAYWLTLPWVRSILMVALLVGAYIEFQAPGVGIAGLVAITALLLLLIAPFLVGLAQVWHVILFLFGLVMVVMEILVIPGFGVAGIGGIVCMFVGLVLMVVPTSGQGLMPLPAPEAAKRLRDSVLFSLLGIITSGIGFYYLTKFFGSLPLLNRLVLSNPTPEPNVGLQPHNHVSGDEVIAGGRLTLGANGRAITPLRPSGRAEFGDLVIDVISEGQWLESGQPIRIIEIHGNRIVVESNSTDPPLN